MNTTQPLTQEEKMFTAIAIFSMTMKLGPPSFEKIQRLVAKLEVTAEFEYYANDWNDYAEHKRLQKINENRNT